MGDLVITSPELEKKASSSRMLGVDDFEVKSMLERLNTAYVARSYAQLESLLEELAINYPKAVEERNSAIIATYRDAIEHYKEMHGSERLLAQAFRHYDYKGIIEALTLCAEAGVLADLHNTGTAELMSLVKKANEVLKITEEEYYLTHLEMCLNEGESGKASRILEAAGELHSKWEEDGTLIGLLGTAIKTKQGVGNSKQAQKQMKEFADGVAKMMRMVPNPMEYWQQYPGLRTPDDYSKKLLNKAKAKAGMYSFTAEEMPRSLIDYKNKEKVEYQGKETAPNKLSASLFRTIQVVMGDRKPEKKDPTIYQMLQNAMQLCIELDQFRDEIFCLLMKQLTKNPTDSSEIIGWRIMALMCSTFPPSTAFVNYLWGFLEHYGCKKFIGKDPELEKMASLAFNKFQMMLLKAESGIKLPFLHDIERVMSNIIVEVDIHLPDGTKHNMPLTKDITTVGDLVDIVLEKEKLKKKDIATFGLYLMATKDDKVIELNCFPNPLSVMQMYGTYMSLSKSRKVQLMCRRRFFQAEDHRKVLSSPRLIELLKCQIAMTVAALSLNLECETTSTLKELQAELATTSTDKFFANKRSQIGMEYIHTALSASQLFGATIVEVAMQRRTPAASSRRIGPDEEDRLEVRISAQSSLAKYLAILATSVRLLDAEYSDLIIPMVLHDVKLAAVDSNTVAMQVTDTIDGGSKSMFHFTTSRAEEVDETYNMYQTMGELHKESSPVLPEPALYNFRKKMPAKRASTTSTMKGMDYKTLVRSRSDAGPSLPPPPPPPSLEKNISGSSASGLSRLSLPRGPPSKSSGGTGAFGLPPVPPPPVTSLSTPTSVGSFPTSPGAASDMSDSPLSVSSRRSSEALLTGIKGFKRSALKSTDSPLSSSSTSSSPFAAGTLSIASLAAAGSSKLKRSATVDSPPRAPMSIADEMARGPKLRKVTVDEMHTSEKKVETENFAFAAKARLRRVTEDALAGKSTGAGGSAITSDGTAAAGGADFVLNARAKLRRITEDTMAKGPSEVISESSIAPIVAAVDTSMASAVKERLSSLTAPKSTISPKMVSALRRDIIDRQEEVGCRSPRNRVERVIQRKEVDSVITRAQLIMSVGIIEEGEAVVEFKVGDAVPVVEEAKVEDAAASLASVSSDKWGGMASADATEPESTATEVKVANKKGKKPPPVAAKPAELLASPAM